jgi:regulator of protease activity HflC (stomatin/prohibitin superfamily)
MGGGLNSIVGLLALVGFVIFLAGVGLVVLNSSQGRSPRGGVLLAVIGLVTGILFAIISNGLLFVDVRQVAVITNTLTGSLETPRGPGTSIIIPGLQVPTFYPTNQLSYTMSEGREQQANDDSAVVATTVDGQSISLDVTIFYSINPAPDAVNEFHRRWGTGYENYVRSTGRTVVRDVVATFRAEAIYGQGRVDMQVRINERMQQELEREGFILNDVQVRGVQFSQSFVEAIEAAAAAEQRAVQARQEAERARTIAAGERDAAIARAEGVAQSTILQAQAEAEGLRLVSEQIAANPLLIQYEYVRNLSDNVSIALVPSNSPFLFDFQSIANGVGAVPPPATQPEATPTPGS